MKYPVSMKNFLVVLMVLCMEANGASKFKVIAQKPVNYRVPVREYEMVSTNGWTFEVEKQLCSDDPGLEAKAVARLARKLEEALAVLPEACRDKMRKHKVFLMYGPKAKGDGRDNGGEYYQPSAPACRTNLDTRWGGNIVVYCAENYVWQTEFWALKLILHELAHAYHLDHWPEDQADMCRAYEHAVSRELYRNVWTDQGKIREKAYAVQNPMEYFAELSCMYFAGCDYRPRDRKALKAYDPEGYAMVQKLWGVNDCNGEAAPEAAKRYGESIVKSRGLLGYWPLADSLKAGVGGLELVAVRTNLSLSAGPFGGTCVDLSDGNGLTLNPVKALDEPRLGVELMFEITKPTAGNLCLAGVRGANATRFSLHYNAESRCLILYNGAGVGRFECNDTLTVNQWFHLAVSVADGGVRIWLNGKECVRQGDGVAVNPVAGLPLVVGASDVRTGFEHADIRVAHLAVYQEPLTVSQIAEHMKAAGWGKKLQERFVWQKSPVSILASQIGYHPLNTKHVYLRRVQENPPEGVFEKKFGVFDAKTDKEVFRGKVVKWGQKWETFWWVLDFTPLRQAGEFYVKTGTLMSNNFNIDDGVFRKTDLEVIALDQLEYRIHQGVDDHRRGLQGLYTNCPPETRIYMDCGSPYSELEPVGTCVYALMDLHELLGREFSEQSRKRMINLAALGADYFVAAQRSSPDPELDGMFYHSLLVNNHDTWAGNFSTYLDAAYGMALMARAHQFFKAKDPLRAAHYLEAATKAWKLCVHRPRHTRADRTPPYGCNAWFWNAPVDIQQTFGRSFYNILDKSWKMPDTLRTRDRLPFIQGSSLLYEITGESKYLEKAVEFADAVVERQFTDWEHPIESCFGTFYEFEGNNEAFFHEFMQGGFWWEGNVEALNLEGLMHLLRLAPKHPKAAMWQNTILTYAENYARKATTLNPLGIYPVACYKDPAHGGLKYFQNTLMGSSCLYGFSAKNFMVLGDFLKDSRFQSQALAGVNFIGGLNPGIPNAYEETAWDARTLIAGVGRSWFGPAGDLAETARGSVPNGFCAAPQFWQPTFDNFISYQSDKPRGMVNKGGGLQFNEGWILHSHAYVQAVAHLEAGYTWTLRTLSEGKPVKAGVSVVLEEAELPHGKLKRTFETDDDGALVVTNLPTPCSGRACITYNGREITRPVAAIAGGRHALAVDFAQEVDLEIRIPETMVVGTRAEAKFVIRNTGSKEIKLKLLLSASGLLLSQTRLDLTLKPGRREKVSVPFECGPKVMPCLVRAIIDEGAPVRDFTATGRIGSGIR